MRHSFLGGIVVAVIAAVSLVVFSGISDQLLREKGDKYHAIVADTGMLAKGSPVRVKGVDAGQVTKLELTPDGRSTNVTFEVFHDALPLYRDATATVAFRNVLGGNDSLNLTRGTPSTGTLTSRLIPEAHTGGQVEVDQILSTLKDPERAGLQTLLSQIPHALSDSAGPAQALSAVAAAAPDLTVGLQAARGERDGDLRRLIRNTASTVDALDDDPQALRDLVGDGAITLDATSRRAEDIKATITEGAAVLPRVRTTLGQLQTTLGKANTLLSALREPSPELAPTLRTLRPAVVDTHALLDDAEPLLTALRPAAADLAVAARQGLPLVKRLTPSLHRLGATTLTDLNKVDQTSLRSTAAMIGPTISGLQGAASNLDKNGFMVGLGLGASERSVSSLPCQTYFTQPGTQQLVHCDQLAQALSDLLGFNPVKQR